MDCTPAVPMIDLLFSLLYLVSRRPGYVCINLRRSRKDGSDTQIVRSVSRGGFCFFQGIGCHTDNRIFSKDLSSTGQVLKGRQCWSSRSYNVCLLTDIVLSNMDTLNSCCKCNIDAIVDEEGYICGLCDLV